MSTRLNGKVAFVTGAAQGIGRSIAEAFAREGAKVIATDVQDAKLAELNALGVTTERLDVTDAAAVRAAAARHADVDVLVNCVGYVAAGTILDCSEDDFQRSLTLNLATTFNVTKAFLPAMLAARNGSIINIASVVSSTRGAPNRFAYGATKAAVIGMTKSIARDFADKGVRCNAISPGTVATPSLDERITAQGDYEQVKAAFIARQPMGRLGRPDEVANVAVLLASDEGAFMTGSDVIIDGGMSV